MSRQAKRKRAFDDLFAGVKCTATRYLQNADRQDLVFHADIKIRVLTSKDIPLVLECTNRSVGDKMQWLKEKLPVTTTLGGNEDVFKIDNETGTLEILKDIQEVYGNYTCKVANSTTEYRVVREYPSAIILLLHFRT